MLRLIGVLCLVLLASPALAIDDPDTEVARRHFEQGRVFYDSKDYRHALDEFLAARRAKAAPGLDYNIARCYDRLEEYRLAVKHYQLYLDGKPNATDVAEIKERIGVLTRRSEEAEAAKQKGVQPPPRGTEPEPPPLLPSALDGAQPAVPAMIDQRAQIERDERARRRRNGAIAGGVVAGAIVIGGAIVLGILLSQPSGGSLTKSDLGPFTVTK